MWRITYSILFIWLIEPLVSISTGSLSLTVELLFCACGGSLTGPEVFSFATKTKLTAFADYRQRSLFAVIFTTLSLLDCLFIRFL